MAEGHSMTAAERAAKTLLTEQADVLRDAVATVVAGVRMPPCPVMSAGVALIG